MPNSRPKTRRAAAIPAAPLATIARAPGVFAEAPAWQSVGKGWRPLFGSFRDLGFSFEWHDFHSDVAFDWARSFHPGSIELCLNLAGHASVSDGREAMELTSQTLGFYHQGEPALQAVRKAGERHQFITLEFSPSFLAKHLGEQMANLHPMVREVIQAQARRSAVSPVERLNTALLPVVESLQHPPVFAPAQSVWFQCKAVELAAQLFFRPPQGELFCTRAQRAARDRVERVRSILRDQLQQPPSLDELGRTVGCSPFYLSRLFSQETGMTIQEFLRQVRMEKAAELLRSGKFNVTEAALEVGYSSLSHFSTAFRETFGCCPGLFPLQTSTQKPPSGSSLP